LHIAFKVSNVGSFWIILIYSAYFSSAIYIFAPKLKKMKIAAANKLIDTIVAEIEKNGINVESLVPQLQQVREHALAEADPLVTKVLRLTYEYLQENDGAFNIQAQYEEDEEGGEYPLEIEDQENLVCLLNLLKHADNKINREEIKDYRSALKEVLY